MLNSLSIRNVVLIDKLDLTFENGLGTFTGETGAGKSILLDSLSLILGARADTSLIRYGENQLSVTAEFTNIPSAVLEILKEQEIEIEDDTIIIRRVVTKEGKSKSFINDQNVSVNFLKLIGENLVEIHGQFSTHGLLNPSTHLSVLDSFGKLDDEIKKTKALWQNYKKACTETASLKEKIEKSILQKQYIEESLSDLKNINPQKGEEESLTQKRNLLMNSEKVLSCTNTAYQLLNDEQKGVSHQLAQTSRQLEKAAQFDSETFDEILQMVYQVQETVSEIIEKIELESEKFGNTQELPIIDDRLFALRALSRKHNTDIESLPDLIISLQKDLDSIEHGDTLLKELEQVEQELLKQYINQAKTLSSKRKSVAQELDQRIQKELPDLKLEKAIFKTSIETDASKKSDNGIDDLVFTVSTNSGTPLCPINKIASGGELSRFMLALKVNLAKESSLPTIIFDEIDSGMGGATADAIGYRLKKLSTDCQVLCVTHAPQVAAYAHQHFVVSKKENNGTVTTTVQELSTKERLTEIARMLSGAKITQTAEIMAQELLEKTLL